MPNNTPSEIKMLIIASRVKSRIILERINSPFCLCFVFNLEYGHAVNIVNRIVFLFLVYIIAKFLYINYVQTGVPNKME